MKVNQQMTWQVIMTKDSERSPVYWRLNPHYIRRMVVVTIASVMTMCMLLILLCISIYRQNTQIHAFEVALEKGQDELLSIQEMNRLLQEQMDILQKEKEAILPQGGGPSKVQTLDTYFSESIVEEPTEAVEISSYEPTYKPCEGTITSPFGYRQDPFNTSRSEQHTGIDIAAPKGAPIYAAAAGQVQEARFMNGYGYAVFIDHGDSVETRYAHASKLHVEAGEMVEKGQHIADIGSTGNSTGPHLHFELIENGEQKNPEKIFLGE